MTPTPETIQRLQRLADYVDKLPDEIFRSYTYFEGVAPGDYGELFSMRTAMVPGNRANLLGHATALWPQHFRLLPQKTPSGGYAGLVVMDRLGAQPAAHGCGSYGPTVRSFFGLSIDEATRIFRKHVKRSRKNAVRGLRWAIRRHQRYLAAPEDVTNWRCA